MHKTMELQKAENLGMSGKLHARLLVTGDLQIAVSEEKRKELLVDTYMMNPKMLEEMIHGREDRRAIFEAVKDAFESFWTGVYSLSAIEYETLEPLSWNGFLAWVNPEEIGVLTDAPILALGLWIGDDGKITNPPGFWREEPKIWWYPEYCLKSFVEDLIFEGETIFTRGNA
jgi:hypothetical protein